MKMNQRPKPPILNWGAGKLVGIEMLNADRGLQGDLRWKDELSGSWIT
jgi:hypothetical protein